MSVELSDWCEVCNTLIAEKYAHQMIVGDSSAWKGVVKGGFEIAGTNW
jgi:hypothetical protein